MRVIIPFLISAIACSQISAKDKPRYELMDHLWSGNAKKNEVIDVFGVPSEIQDEGIIYRLNQSRSSIESAHFFDKNDRLESQFILLTENELQNLKDRLKCPWEIQKKVLNTSHSVRTIESGKCISKNISYEFRPISVLYEVRWERVKSKQVTHSVFGSSNFEIGQHGPTLEEPVGVDLTYPIQWRESKVDLSELAKLSKEGWTTDELASRFKRKASTIRGYYLDILKEDCQFATNTCSHG